MNVRVVTGVAFFGLFLVLASSILRLLKLGDFDIRSGMLVIGFTLMLLGTIWRVVIEMNAPEDENSDS